jgi:hypothetical protein
MRSNTQALKSKYYSSTTFDYPYQLNIFIDRYDTVSLIALTLFQSKWNINCQDLINCQVSRMLREE